MNNLPLQPLVWNDYGNGTASESLSPLHEYDVRQTGGTGWVVGYFDRRNLTGIKQTTGFATIDEAKVWAWSHYNKEMRPYLNEPTLNDAMRFMVGACHGASVEGGWWHDLPTGELLQSNKLEMIALIHNEINEVVEGVRKGINDDHLPQYPMEDAEMADALIRIFDYIGGYNLQTANALVDKLSYNANRADHKPENRAKAGGKKY